MGNCQAVILAAGMGVRLNSVVQDMPKGLVEVGGQALVARSVENLRFFGIDEIVLVTGYKSELYEAFAKDKEYVILIHNDQYLSSGNMYSFYLTRNILKGDILLLESDVIYEKRALGEMINSQSENGILLSGFTGAGDEVYVSATDGRVDGISKHKDVVNCVVGEWVGISKVSRSLQQAMFDWADEQFEGSLLGDYESDCLAQVAQHHAIAFEKVNDLAWSEMDDAQHYQRMIQEVLPRVLHNDATYFPDKEKEVGALKL
ncbi:MAG: phosphocholine cytidylyltransferase family protein [Candidatus Latescibacteria bacterium]|jgi:2-aminoethylphosphonate-pyruvate transaminase|nr:phosphocholine cytidylyltransferase family protein [Candidatus Latescibacterota bacterium]